MYNLDETGCFGELFLRPIKGSDAAGDKEDPIVILQIQDVVEVYTRVDYL